jgi:DNA-binding response OmpR family regulator
VPYGSPFFLKLRLKLVLIRTGVGLMMRRMIIVDDEVDICECLEDFFSSHGFAVASAFSGEEALSKLESDGAEVILLDINLPGLQGIEVLQRIKKTHPRTKVIMVTGLTDPELKTRARRFGACGFVLKPFDFSENTWAPVFS